MELKQSQKTQPQTTAARSAFEWSKLIGERYVEYYARQHKVRACIFRLSTVYARASPDNASGFVTHYVESIKHRTPIRLPAGADPVRDLLYVDDFSRACQFFIGSKIEFGLYNLGGGPGNALSLRDIVKRVGEMIRDRAGNRGSEYAGSCAGALRFQHHTRQ